MKWIKTDDELPKHGKPVIGYYDERLIEIVILRMDEDGEEYWDYFNDDGEGMPPIYWSSMPNPYTVDIYK